MNQSLILAVDVATSGIKVALYDDVGKKQAENASPYSLYTSEHGYAEQKADEILQAFDSAVRATLKQAQNLGFHPNAIRVISLGGVMHSVLGVHANGTPTTAVMTWADTRSARQADALRIVHGGALYQRIGVPLHAMLPLTKIAWLSLHQQDVMRVTAKFISIKEYIAWHLTGRYLVDYSTATASGLLNIHTLTWEQEALDFAMIAEDQLSEVVPCTAGFPLQPTAQTWLGLESQVDVVIGSTDGLLANLGCGATGQDQVAITLGSSGAARRMVDHPALETNGRTFCYPLSTDLYVVGGPTNSGGIVWKWVQSVFPAPDEEALLEALRLVPAGANGLRFLPYLAGERAPVWDDSARGAFTGLSLHHTRDHIWKAAAEGIVMALGLVYQIVRSLGPTPRQAIGTGGFVSSPIWSQLIADVLGTPLQRVVDEEASLRGSFLLGAAHLHGIRLQALTQTFPVEHQSTMVFPDMEHHHVYTHMMSELLPLHHALDTIDRPLD